MLGSLLLLMLIAGLIAVLPVWPYSANIGFLPSGLLLFALIVMLMFLRLIERV